MADRVLAVYVAGSKDGPRNFATGMAAEVWGWRRDHPDHRALDAGDWLVLAFHGRGSQVRSADIQKAVFRQVHVARVRGPVYVDRSPLWHDDVYPYRVRFDVIESQAEVPAGALPPGVVEGLRVSSTTWGRGVLVDTPDPVLDVTAHAAELERVVGLEGDLDRRVSAKARREQDELRRMLLGPVPAAACALCGLVLPVELLVAAHVKLRSACSSDEQRDAEVVIPACTLGCDALFEKGYLGVGASGEVLVCADAATPDLAEKLRAWEGRVCGTFTKGRMKYFEWHRSERFRGH